MGGYGGSHHVTMRSFHPFIDGQHRSGNIVIEKVPAKRSFQAFKKLPGARTLLKEYCPIHYLPYTPRNCSQVRFLHSTSRAFAAQRYDGRVLCWGDANSGGDVEEASKKAQGEVCW